MLKKIMSQSDSQLLGLKRQKLKQLMHLVIAKIALVVYHSSSIDKRVYHGKR
jgi:hypothetical protein